MFVWCSCDNKIPCLVCSYDALAAVRFRSLYAHMMLLPQYVSEPCMLVWCSCGNKIPCLVCSYNDLAATRSVPCMLYDALAAVRLRALYVRMMLLWQQNSMMLLLQQYSVEFLFIWCSYCSKIPCHVCSYDALDVTRFHALYVHIMILLL